MHIHWEGAQREAEQRLESVRRRISELEQQTSELAKESTNLELFIQTAKKMDNSKFWETLLGKVADRTAIFEFSERLEGGKAPGPRDLGPTELRFAQTTVDQFQERATPAELPKDLPALPFALSVKRQPDPTNTSYRIAALMLMKGEPMDFDEVWREFENRHWIDPAWEKPREAILQAMRRTERYGWTRRLSSRKFVYDPAIHAADRALEEATRGGGARVEETA